MRAQRSLVRCQEEIAYPPFVVRPTDEEEEENEEPGRVKEENGDDKGDGGGKRVDMTGWQASTQRSPLKLPSCAALGGVFQTQKGQRSPNSSTTRGSSTNCSNAMNEDS